MSVQHISKQKRIQVAIFSNYRCGYCLTSQKIIGPYLEIDHIIPEAKGGTADDENLILACPTCNSYKYTHTEGLDPQTKSKHPLFNPRTDHWQEHFQWDKDSVRIIGKTPKGRRTIATLNMNHPDVVSARQLWVLAGWHPPKE